MILRVVLLVATGIVLSSTEMYLLAGGLSDVFSRRTTLTTYMADAAGVTTASEVRLSGLHIGDVSGVELTDLPDPQRAVRVQMRVLTRYLKYIPSDSQTDVNADTIVADKYVDVDEGKSALPTPENAVLQSKPMPLANDRGSVIQALQDRLSQVDQILVNISSPDTDIGKFVHGEREYDAVVTGIGVFDRDLRTFVSPTSDLGRAIFSPELYNKDRDFISNADKTLAAIQNGEGTTGHMFATDEQYNAWLQEIGDLRAYIADANAGKGRLGTFLQDDESYTNFARLLKSTDATLAALNAGQGAVGNLLSNAQLYESLSGSMKDLQAMLQDFGENPKKYLRVRHKIF